MGTKNKPGKFDCFAVADPDEEMFILLARDMHAPAVVRFWADCRVEALRSAEASGFSIWRREREEEKIAEARACADRMEAQHRDTHKAQDLGITLADLAKTSIGPSDV